MFASTYVTFGKRQNHRDRNKSVVARDWLGEGLTAKGNSECFVADDTILYFDCGE